jgi:hypothetical protein
MDIEMEPKNRGCYDGSGPAYDEETTKEIKTIEKETQKSKKELQSSIATIGITLDDEPPKIISIQNYKDPTQKNI